MSRDWAVKPHRQYGETCICADCGLTDEQFAAGIGDPHECRGHAPIFIGRTFSIRFEIGDFRFAWTFRIPLFAELF